MSGTHLRPITSVHTSIFSSVLVQSPDVSSYSDATVSYPPLPFGHPSPGLGTVGIPTIPSVLRSIPEKEEIIARCAACVIMCDSHLDTIQTNSQPDGRIWYGTVLLGEGAVEQGPVMEQGDEGAELG